MATHSASQPAHPYLDLAIATNFAYLRPGTWLPLLVEFSPSINPRAFSKGDWLPSQFKSDVLISRIFVPNRRSKPGANISILLLRKGRARALTTDPAWGKTILRAELGPPVDASTYAKPSINPALLLNALRDWLTPPPANAPCRDVLVGVIDQGIAFAHPRFRTPASTRVEYVWQQDSSGTVSLWPPFGNELTAAQIDLAVSNATSSGNNDESIYRAIGGLDFAVDGFKPLARRRSHGTHVLDLAAGFDPARAIGNRPIIAVDMPESAVGDPAGSTLVGHAFFGLLYIVARAALSVRKPGQTLPIVVNISYGPQDGPHDGSSVFEQWVDWLIGVCRSTKTPLQVVLAAGNFRQARTHANFTLQTGSQQLAWRLQPSGLTPSFMEIWVPATEAATVSVTLTSPDGRQVTVSAIKLNDALPAGGAPPAMGAAYYPPGALGNRCCVVLYVAPTANDPWIAGTHPVVPSGIWTVSIVRTGPALQNAPEFDAWIKRSDTRGGRRPKGRQSYFDDAPYQESRHTTRPCDFDTTASYVKRRGTLSGIATGSSTYVIGAYRRSPDSNGLMPARYTSEGWVHPIPGRIMNAPNWLAPGEDSVSCGGALGAGPLGAVRIAMNGTSVAAPQAARYYASVWESGTVPGGSPPGLQPPSTHVPAADRTLVAGNGLMNLRPPNDKVWKERP